ncbi:MAG: hypothetical protein V4581_15935 [Bacteroidota bacterium]
MKKLIVLSAVLMTALSLTSCDPKKTGTEGEPTDTIAKTGDTVVTTPADTVKPADTAKPVTTETAAPVAPAEKK